MKRTLYKKITVIFLCAFLYNITVPYKVFSTKSKTRNHEYDEKVKTLSIAVQEIKENILKTIINDLAIKTTGPSIKQAIKTFYNRFSDDYIKMITMKAIKYKTLYLDSINNDAENENYGPHYILESFRSYWKCKKFFLEKWVVSLITMFIKTLAPLTEINTINVDGNELKEVPVELTNAIQRYVQSIKKLSLSFNKITIIPDQIKQFKSLEEISAIDNKLKYPPLEILELPNLKECFLFDNPYMDTMNDDDLIRFANGKASNMTLSKFRKQLLTNIAANNEKYKELLDANEIDQAPF